MSSAPIHTRAVRTEADNSERDYWVADVIVIEVNGWNGDVDNISLVFDNFQQTSQRVKFLDTLTTKYEGVNAHVIPGDEDWGIRWSDVQYGFYELMDTEKDGDELVADNINPITKNFAKYGIKAGVVTRVDPRNGNVSLRIGTGPESTEAMLAASEQIKTEELVEGQHVKVYVVEVRRSTRGPQVLISRTHPGLVKRLFELEVPEIYDGTVEVKSIAREAGSRTKMAVWSSDEAVDPIGACVGPSHQRVGSIVNELRGEKIDIIKYSEDPAEFIAAALAPAEVVDVWMVRLSVALRDAKKLVGDFCKKEVQ